MGFLAGGEADQVGVAPIVDHFGKLAHVGADRQVGVIDVAELVGVGVDVDEGLAGMVGRDQFVAVGRRFAEAGADGDDQVGVADALLELGVGPVAELAGIDSAGVADGVLAAEGGGDGDAVAEGEIGEMMRGARAPVGPADDRDGIGRFLQKLEQGLDRAGIGRFGDRRDGRAVERLDLVAQHVLGDCEHHRAGPAGGRDAISAGDIFGDAAGIVDPRRPFGDRPEEGREVDFLEALAVLVGAVEVADEQDHRGRILEGDMDSGGGVGRAGAAGDEGDARAAGHLAVGIGHVGDSAFLPADGKVDLRRVMERVEHGEEAFARHREDAVAALDFELVDEDASASSGTGALGHLLAPPPSHWRGERDAAKPCLRARRRWCSAGRASCAHTSAPARYRHRETRSRGP